MKFSLYAGKFDGTRQTMEKIAEVEIPDGTFLQQLRMTDETGRPIFQMPFYYHGKSIHTVCSQDGESLDSIEW